MVYLSSKLGSKTCQVLSNNTPDCTTCRGSSLGTYQVFLASWPKTNSHCDVDFSDDRVGGNFLPYGSTIAG